VTASAILLNETPGLATPKSAESDPHEQDVNWPRPVPAPPGRMAAPVSSIPDSTMPGRSSTRSNVLPAPRYHYVNDLCVVTCYFNSQGYSRKRRNYDLFQRSITDSGIHLITVECAFRGTAFELDHTPHVIRLRAKHVMWQKERLLNLAIRRAPRLYTKIAWLDCDVLFENASWAEETSRILEEYPVVQPFHYAFRLRPGERAYCGKGERYRSYAAVHTVFPSIARAGDFFAHGHTGFAWAAQRDLLEDIGLYDAAITGTGDHLIAHAFCGDFGSLCLDDTFLDAKGYLTHYKAWAEAAWQQVRGRISFATGALLHLWHGEVRNRRYLNRNVELANLGFDPALDLLTEDNGLWQWSGHNPAIATWANSYFDQRCEDMSERHITEDV
jgi:hypothetical protein